ncbi:MAG TPA: hypothetical protein VGF61_05350 [Candidatus Acidoferrum sp.]|jgi:hypothetical protein
MKKAAVGFRVHSGWSAVVAVSLEKSEPMVLRRQRAQLVKTFSYTFRQPYHTGEKIGLAEAGAFIAGVRTEAEALACESLRSIEIDLKEQGYQLERAALLLSSGRALPELEKILQSHALIHTADGELFREALRSASTRCGLRVECTRERELLERCAVAFTLRKPVVLRRATELGKGLGAPWSQDEKFATLAAWLALAGSPVRSRKVQTAARA